MSKPIDKAYIKDGRCWYPCQSHPDRECWVPVKPKTVQGMPSWTADGPDDAPTLSPSINCSSERCWHGFIVNGEVRNPLNQPSKTETRNDG